MSWANRNRCGQRSSMGFTALVQRLWLTPFLIPLAKRIHLEVEYTNSDLIVRVRDDGCGIDPRILNNGREGQWGWPGCVNGSQKSAGSSKSLLVQPVRQRSNSPSQVLLRSNDHPLLTGRDTFTCRARAPRGHGSTRVAMF